MKFLLWKITFEPYRLAKVQWFLYKLLKVKPKKHPCGHTKSSRGYYCHQPFGVKYCDVINDKNRHEVVCKCCKHVRIDSNRYINPFDDENWLSFD